jgi:multidrug transporter EmrE-like cation transporter
VLTPAAVASGRKQFRTLDFPRLKQNPAMTSKGLLLLFVTAAFTAIANLLMKGGILRNGGLSPSLPEFGNLIRQPMFVSGIVLVGMAGLIWFRILSTENLTVSYPLFVSLSYSMIACGSVYFFSEALSPQKLLAIGLILLGMVVMART